MCGLTPAGDIRLPDVGDGFCCEGRIDEGPAFCTCWKPEYDDLEQQNPDDLYARALAAGFPPATREQMCGDCAYRPGSPEKSGSLEHAGDTEALERYARSGARFFCHQGIRRPVRLRHPCGAVIDGGAADYRPPILAGVPWRADGSPAELCAGWDARRRALAARADG